jgi:flagellar protein FlgJ
MSGITSVPPTPSHPGAISAASDDARLKKTAFQLEGLFVQRMFAAMRDTVPDNGLVPQGNGESTFTGMLDEKMAEKVPTQWNGEHSLAQALYHQLRQRITPPAADPATGAKPR